MLRLYVASGHDSKLFMMHVQTPTHIMSLAGTLARNQCDEICQNVATWPQCWKFLAIWKRFI